MTAILKVDTIQDTAGNNIINENANTVTIGKAGDTVNVVGTLQNNSSALISGITEADQWRLTTSFTNTASPIASNLERNDNNFSLIGTGMTESSGIFTFPSTGIYYITFYRMAEWNSNDRNNVNEIQLSTNSGSSFSNVATGYGSISVTTSNYTRAMESTSVIIDVTNVSTFRVRFNAVTTNGSTASTTVGSTSENLTHMTFIRLGDT